MKKIIAIILVLISVNSYSQILYLNYAAKKDTALWQTNGANIINKNTGNTGIGVAPLNKLHIGAASVANTGGIRLPITSVSAAQTGQPIGVDANGDIVRLAAASFDATVSFSTLTPTTGGVVFTPNTPASTTVLYVSAVDGSQWTYNGTIYVTQPASADWKTAGNAGSVQATNFIGTTDNVGLSFRTNNVIRQTISNTGNVGIGTTTPTEKLSVYSTKALTQTATPDAISLGGTFSNTAGTNLKLKLFDESTGSVGGFGISPSQMDYKVWSVNVDHVYYANTAEIMRIKGNGNVGIGTATPTQKLTVQGGILTTAGSAISGSGAHLQWNKVVGTGATYLINQNGTGPGGIIFGQSTTADVFTEFGRFGSTGNLGIGTNAPSTKLHVAGQVKITGGVPGVGKVLTSDATGLATWETSSGGATIGDAKSGFQSVDHGGWVKLDGRLKTSLTATQQAQATALGIGANIPNATGRAFTQGTLLAQIGSTSIALNQLPNYVPSLSIGTRGVASGANYNMYSSSGNFTGSSATDIAMGSINGNQTQLGYTPASIGVNQFIYLGL